MFRISLGEFSVSYETYHTRILFFERYVRMLTYPILAYAYPRALSGTYKIITGEYQPCVADTLHNGNVFVTRGNDLRLEKSQVKYDLRRFGFTNRVVNTWNSLSNWVVSANTNNTFKTRFDKFWHNQDIIYNFRHS